MSGASLLHPIAALLLAPLLFGVINRTKAFFAGRCGQPLLQPYRDLLKLSRKGAVYSRTTTWVFLAGPVVGIAAMLAGLTMMPMGSVPALLAFPGDFVVVVSLLGLVRFLTIVAALDTGSSFEGMGASREAAFSALTEPAVLLGFAVLARLTGSLSVSAMAAGVNPGAWGRIGPALVLLSAAMMAVLLTENARIPVDDPNTHLELTMIHEVMVLDHGGPDLALIQYAAALKLWLLGSLIAGVLAPLRSGLPWLDAPAFLAGLGALAVLIGVIESSMARLRLFRVPQFLAGAIAFAVLALILVLR